MNREAVQCPVCGASVERGPDGRMALHGARLIYGIPGSPDGVTMGYCIGSKRSWFRVKRLEILGRRSELHAWPHE